MIPAPGGGCIIPTTSHPLLHSTLSLSLSLFPGSSQGLKMGSWTDGPSSTCSILRGQQGKTAALCPVCVALLQAVPAAFKMQWAPPATGCLTLTNRRAASHRQTHTPASGLRPPTSNGAAVARPTGGLRISRHAGEAAVRTHNNASNRPAALLLPPPPQLSVPGRRRRAAGT